MILHAKSPCSHTAKADEKPAAAVRNHTFMTCTTPIRKLNIAWPEPQEAPGDAPEKTRSWGVPKTYKNPISPGFIGDIYIYILVSNFAPHIDKDTYVYMLFLLFIISSGK